MTEISWSIFVVVVVVVLFVASSVFIVLRVTGWKLSRRLFCCQTLTVFLTQALESFLTFPLSRNFPFFYLVNPTKREGVRVCLVYL